ncbi:MAG: hypothetical protein AB8B60_01085 [Sulfitobacter sp.]
MLGVVLWSDQVDQKAVFWCEDHGDLAYYDASADDFIGNVMLQAGDMVQFEISALNKVRRAHNACVVEQRGCDGLQDDLRDSVAKQSIRAETVSDQSKVVPFRRQAANAQHTTPRRCNA